MAIDPIHGPFLFGSADKLLDLAADVPSLPWVVVLRLRNMTAIDVTGLHALEQFADVLRASGRTLVLCGMRDQPARMMARAEFHRRVGDDNIVPSIEAALTRAQVLSSASGSGASGRGRGLTPLWTPAPARAARAPPLVDHGALAPRRVETVRAAGAGSGASRRRWASSSPSVVMTCFAPEPRGSEHLRGGGSQYSTVARRSDPAPARHPRVPELTAFGGTPCAEAGRPDTGVAPRHDQAVVHDGWTATVCPLSGRRLRHGRLQLPSEIEYATASDVDAGVRDDQHRPAGASRRKTLAEDEADHRRLLRATASPAADHARRQTAQKVDATMTTCTHGLVNSSAQAPAAQKAKPRRWFPHRIPRNEDRPAKEATRQGGRCCHPGHGRA